MEATDSVTPPVYNTPLLCCNAAVSEVVAYNCIKQTRHYVISDLARIKGFNALVHNIHAHIVVSHKLLATLQKEVFE